MGLPRRFRRLQIDERRAAVEQASGVDSAAFGSEPRLIDLSDVMVEAAVGYTAIPIGIATGFVINGTPYDVPLATEEPSVIAAASFAAGIVARSAGFRATAPEPITTGQIYLEGCDPSQVPTITGLEEELRHHVAPLLERMARRGGGWRSMEVTHQSETDLIRIQVRIDVRDAMGANAVNSVMESLRAPLESSTRGRVVMAILSNEAAERLTTATLSLPAERLARAGIAGAEVARRLVLASEIARTDPARAVTHNKGIMNGISALALATGNDTRAVEAAAHTYASRDGVYRGLSRFTLEGDRLEGHLEMPIAVGTVGGAAGIHPASSAALSLLGKPSGRELAAIACAVGLGQNLAALLALVTEGIQSGHMRLHAHRLAWAAGADSSERADVVGVLEERGNYSREAARDALTEIRSRGTGR